MIHFHLSPKTCQASTQTWGMWNWHLCHAWRQWQSQVIYTAHIHVSKLCTLVDMTLEVWHSSLLNNWSNSGHSLLLQAYRQYIPQNQSNDNKNTFPNIWSKASSITHRSSGGGGSIFWKLTVRPDWTESDLALQTGLWPLVKKSKKNFFQKW